MIIVGGRDKCVEYLVESGGWNIFGDVCRDRNNSMNLSSSTFTGVCFSFYCFSSLYSSYSLEFTYISLAKTK